VVVPPPFLRANDLNLALDNHVLLFTLGISIVTGLLFGLAPTLQSTRPDLVAELKERNIASSARQPGFQSASRARGCSGSVLAGRAHWSRLVHSQHE
jgi:hypothetical protein